MSLRRAASVLTALGLCTALAAPAAAQESGTLGFVIRDWYTAMYETKFMYECPEGLSTDSEEFWWRSQTREERARITGNGLIKRSIRFNEVMGRGAQGQNVCIDPTSVVDPPLRVVEGKIGYGENLDGTTDGRATAKTCAHEKFTTPDGKAGVDNQMYRLVGCTYGWRNKGVMELNANEVRGTSGLGMILIEVTGVDDPRNDDDVKVAFYRSIDQYALDANGRPLPSASYRIDTANGKPRYGDTLKGRIKDGVLETDRGDVELPHYGNSTFGRPEIKDMGLRLTIAPDGDTATGMITGYYNVDQFIYEMGGSGQFLAVAQFSCPAMYVAAHQLADGHPDPKTGKCTTLSSAFDIKAYSAFVLHLERERRVASR